MIETWFACGLIEPHSSSLFVIVAVLDSFDPPLLSNWYSISKLDFFSPSFFMEDDSFCCFCKLLTLWDSLLSSSVGSISWTWKLWRSSNRARVEKVTIWTRTRARRALYSRNVWPELPTTNQLGSWWQLCSSTKGTNIKWNFFLSLSFFTLFYSGQYGFGW